VKNCIVKPYFCIFVAHFLYSTCVTTSPNNAVLISYLEVNSDSSVVCKVHCRGLEVFTLDRAISKLPFELGIGPIRSWLASESEKKWIDFWSWLNPFKSTDCMWTRPLTKTQIWIRVSGFAGTGGLGHKNTGVLSVLRIPCRCLKSPSSYF